MTDTATPSPARASRPPTEEWNVYLGITLVLQALLAIGLVLFLLRRDWENVFLTGVVVALTLVPALLATFEPDQRLVNRLMYGRRDEPWQAMRRLGQVLEWAADPDLAFPAIVDTLADDLRLPFVSLAVVDATGTTRTVAERGERRGGTVVLPLDHGGEPVPRAGEALGTDLQPFCAAAPF